MRNPAKTTFKADFFKEMSLPHFIEWWEANSMDGDPKKYYTKWTGEKLPKSTNQSNTNSNNNGTGGTD